MSFLNENGLQRLWEHIFSKISTKADRIHNHNDAYYTKAETDTKISNVNTSIGKIVDGTTVVAKATQDASGNVITNTYETKIDADFKLDEAKIYTDTKVSTFYEENPVAINAILGADGILYFVSGQIENGDEVSY